MLYLNNIFLADIDPYFGELIRKLFCLKYDVASSEGDRTEHKPLPSTGLDSTDCVCRRVRQWDMTVMARSSVSINELTKSVWYKILFGQIFNIELWSRTLKHKTYDVGFYERKIDSVHNSLFWRLFYMFTFLGKKG